MVNQFEIIPFIKRRKVVTANLLMEHFDMSRQSVWTKIKVLNRFGIINIKIDKRVYYISLRDKQQEVEENGRIDKGRKES